MAATGQATLACLMLGLSIATIFAPVKKWHRLIAILAILLIMMYNFALAGRTLIVFLFLLFLLAAVYFRITSENVSERFKIWVGVLLVLLAVVITFAYNIAGLRDFIFDSNLFERFEDSDFSSDRTVSKFQFLRNAWRYPFGGLHLRDDYGYAHDLLLDGYDEYGIFGFLLLLTVLLLGVRSMCKLIFRSTYSRAFRMAFLCSYTSVLLMFLVEPILAGMPWLFTCYCLMNGFMDGMLLKQKERGLL